jgi:hypothetical protein
MKKKEIFTVMVIGKQTPAKTYTDYFEAQDEAIRLVKEERKSAYVLKAVCLVELQEVILTRLDIDYDQLTTTKLDDE